MFRHSIFLFICLFVFWLMLSGKFNAMFITIGALTSAGITWITLPFMKIPSADEKNGKKAYYAFDLHPVRFFGYMFWLIKEVFIANIKVALILINPRLPIDPQMVTIEIKMDNPIAHVVLANSFILTPGTFTVSVENNRYLLHIITSTHLYVCTREVTVENSRYTIHALTKEAAEKVIEEGTRKIAQKKVKSVFTS
ncbi:MAG: Na+/H+ antiporter subunit E [Candidatus Loosdrechtia sp.]|uniref:Na+/H+ antiporter subunit E n=1 Tax=Candidatus Loosdrechtia sp. TaxID=3101272 RepID=UPI003A689652|nr:MAG: Na+/H+ antiporter subunit E [Candidatus Jettenia sp. AMX2]